MPPVEEPERFRRPQRDRLLAEEEPAVVEGTFVAAAAEAVLARMDCWVGSTQPVLPCPDPLAVAAESVHQRDPPQRAAAHRMDFHMPAEPEPAERHRDLGFAEVRLRLAREPVLHTDWVSAQLRLELAPEPELHTGSVMARCPMGAMSVVPRLGHRMGSEMPVEVLEDRQTEALLRVDLGPVLRSLRRYRLLERVRVVAGEEQGAGQTCRLVGEVLGVDRTYQHQEPGAGRTHPPSQPSVVVLGEEEEPGVGHTYPYRPSVVVVALVLAEEVPGVGRTFPYRPSAVDLSCPLAVAAVVAGKYSSPVYPWEQEAELVRRQRQIRKDSVGPHPVGVLRVHPRAMPLERPLQIGQKDCSWSQYITIKQFCNLRSRGWLV